MTQILDKAFEEHSSKNASNTTLDEEKETTYNWKEIYVSTHLSR